MRIILLSIVAFTLWSCSEPKPTGAEASDSSVKESSNAADSSTLAQETPDITPPAAYEAIIWKMFSFTMDGTEYRPYQDTLVTLVLNDSKASGTGGCNQFTGRYQADENGMFRMEELSSTRRTCANLMGTESRYFKVLKEATTWKVDRMVLELSGPTGKIQFLNTSAPKLRVTE